MNPTKKFLLIYAGVAVGVWLVVAIAFGPAGLSKDYLHQYKHEHDHYVEIKKSDAYKRHHERPKLFPVDGPGAPHGLAERVDFVNKYEARPEFQAEQRRIAIYTFIFEFFNAGLVVVLAVRFGKKPLLNFLDEQIAALRERMENAATARKTAEDRRRKAESQLAQIAEEKARVSEQTRERLKRELAELEEANEQSLQVMTEELADRKEREYANAQARVRKALVDQALASLEAEWRGAWDSDRESAQFERFLADVEKGA